MRRRSWARLAALVALLAGVYALAAGTGLTGWLSAERLRGLADEAGAVGLVVFAVAFTAGLFAQVPGMVFIGAAAVAWGPLFGGLVAFASALLAVSVTFWIVRAVGGAPLAELKHPRLRRILDRLEARPVLTVVLLRTLFQVSPPVNYALALGPTRFRHYLAGSAAGLLAPVCVTVTVSHCFLG